MAPDRSKAPGSLPGPATGDQNPPTRPPEPSSKSASARTTDTYDEIAQIYYDHTQDRSPIHDHLDRFIDMIRAYGLAELTVVDVGCGPGYDADYFRRAGLNAVGMDLSMAMMLAGRPVFGGDYVRADMRHLPLAAKVGGLWVNASMLHLPRREAPAVMKRFAALLVPGGLFYLSLKAGQGAEWTADSHGQPLPRYFVYWQPDEADALLKEAGLRIVEGWLSQVGEETTWLFRFARKAGGGFEFPLSIS